MIWKNLIFGALTYWRCSTFIHMHWQVAETGESLTVLRMEIRNKLFVAVRNLSWKEKEKKKKVQIIIILYSQVFYSVPRSVFVLSQRQAGPYPGDLCLMNALSHASVNRAPDGLDTFRKEKLINKHHIYKENWICLSVFFYPASFQNKSLFFF